MVLPSNGKATARLLETFAVREPRGGDFFVMIFSSSEVTKRGKRRRLLLTRASEEALATSHSRREKKTRQRRPFSFLRDGEPWLSATLFLPTSLFTVSFLRNSEQLPLMAKAAHRRSTSGFVAQRPSGSAFSR
ncbi:hypothetical protein BHE74_00022239 [Ensete ventricosum]|nr:hypothetical protein BHE74_00022239 [Ensete ventricosum]